ncbi:MAG: hypothetical protein IPG32_04880 [Saprospirales bacterium]|nr:hypothetical protein [Saprospirales bacterium]
MEEIRTSHLDTTNGTSYIPAAVYGLRYKKYQCGVDDLDNIVCLTPYLESITRYNGSKTDSLPRPYSDTTIPPSSLQERN